MRSNHFSALGLAPARYESAEIARQFFARRAALLAALDRPVTHADARRELDELHIAFRVLHDSQSQVSYLRECSEGGEDRIARMRRLIAASLEDGLLRCSRRERILAEGRRLGLPDFHTQLLIAQTQFGDTRALLDEPAASSEKFARRASDDSTAARLAAAAVLALALLLAVLRWLHV